MLFKHILLKRKLLILFFQILILSYLDLHVPLNVKTIKTATASKEDSF